MATPEFRYVGVTDDCTECQQCGKTQLKNTVVLYFLDEDGNDEEVTYFGSTCAARALGVRGGGRQVLQYARLAHMQTIEAAKEARRMLAHYGLPETGEPDRDTVREAMRRYVRVHPNLHQRVQETGVGVRAMVLDMLERKRAQITEAAVLIDASKEA